MDRTQNRTITAVIVVLALIFLGWLIFFRDGGINFTADQNGDAGETLGERAMSIEDYISSSIGDLAAEQDVNLLAGAEWNVTSVESADGAGTVYFDDGSNSYMADFTYTTDPTTGAISITSFTVYPIVGEKG